MNILYAEDELDIAEIVVTILELDGHSVSHVNNGASAYSMMQDESKHFDLLMTDHMMPKLKGSELVCRIVQEGNQIPVLICSASPNIKRELESIDLSNQQIYFIPKPFDIDQLTNKIKEIENEKSQ
jgi:DNA-binding response OmpR family regulator